MAVATAGIVSVGCSSSSDSDDSAAAGAGAGETGSAGKPGSGSGGAGTDVTSDAGAAGTVSETPAAGGAVDPGPETNAEAGAGGTGAGPDTGPVDVGEAGAGGSAPVAPDPKEAAIARAKKMIAGLEMPCTTCHQGNYAGANYWPNITPDEDTGIGAWSDDDIKKAITQGIGIDDHTFCAEMQRFKWTESQLNDVVTFLHSLKPVSKTITKVCTTK